MDQFTKCKTEVALITETYLVTNLRNGLISFGQHLLSFSDAELSEVRDKRLSCYLLKEPHKVGPTAANDLSCLFNRDLFMVVGVEKIKEGAQAFDRLFFALKDLCRPAIGSVMLSQQDEDHS